MSNIGRININKTKSPTDSQIKSFHKKYAKTDADFALIYTHCQVVDAIAAQLLDTKPNSQIDRDLLHVACMLHDIGAYDVLENGKFVDGVRHGEMKVFPSKFGGSLRTILA